MYFYYRGENGPGAMGLTFEARGHPIGVRWCASHRPHSHGAEKSNLALSVRPSEYRMQSLGTANCSKTLN